jgi:hypothetical protein
MTKELKVLEKHSDDSFIIYWRFKMPMMSDRDNVMHIMKQKREDGSIFTMLKTVERDDAPLVKGVVRCFCFTQGLCTVNKESPDDTIDYTELSYFNMNGYFPARLMNMIIASETKREFGRMY